MPSMLWEEFRDPLLRLMVKVRRVPGGITLAEPNVSGTVAATLPELGVKPAEAVRHLEHRCQRWRGAQRGKPDLHAARG